MKPRLKVDEIWKLQTQENGRGITMEALGAQGREKREDEGLEREVGRDFSAEWGVHISFNLNNPIRYN